MKNSQAVLLAITAVAVRSTAAAAHSPASKGYVASNLTRGPNLLSYHAELEIGTPPQKERLLVDTGSPTHSFISPRNPYCQTFNKPCAYYGTYDNLTSSTSKYAGPGFRDQLVDFGNGDYLTDVVSIGGVATPDMYFGYITDYPFADQVVVPTASILGLALSCNDTSCDQPGPFILPELKKASAIDRMAVSIYLGPDDPDFSGGEMILGGYYDKAKLGGAPFTIPMVDPHSSLSNTGTNVLNVTAITVTVNGTTKEQKYGVWGLYTEGSPTILDTGNSGWGLPTALFDHAMSAFGNYSFDRSDGEAPFYRVDCKYRQPTMGHQPQLLHDEHHRPNKTLRPVDQITVVFGPAGNISVPIHRLVSDFGNGVCGTYLENGFNDGPNLGDPFIRSTYAIWDQEAYTITLAPVKYSVEREIVPFPEGGFKVTEYDVEKFLQRE